MADSSYMQKKAAEYRAYEDAQREPLSRVRCGRRELALTLGFGRFDPWLEVAVWSPAGSPSEARLIERGRACLLLHELDDLITKLQAARARLAKEMNR